MTIKDLPCGCRQRDDITAWRCAYHSGDEDGYQRGLAERDAENARLREALAVAEDGLAKRDAHVGAHKRENIKLKAENTRLREALTSIATIGTRVTTCTGTVRETVVGHALHASSTTTCENLCARSSPPPTSRREQG